MSGTPSLNATVELKAFRRVAQCGVVEHARGIGKCGEHQAIPRPDALAIGGGGHALRPRGQQPFAHAAHA